MCFLLLSCLQFEKLKQRRKSTCHTMEDCAQFGRIHSDVKAVYMCSEAQVWPYVSSQNTFSVHNCSMATVQLRADGFIADNRLDCQMCFILEDYLLFQNITILRKTTVALYSRHNSLIAKTVICQTWQYTNQTDKQQQSILLLNIKFKQYIACKPI